jgi:hypothetical protein
VAVVTPREELTAEAHRIVAPALQRLEAAVAEAGRVIDQNHRFASRLINLVAAHGDADLLHEILLAYSEPVWAPDAWAMLRHSKPR